MKDLWRIYGKFMEDLWGIYGGFMEGLWRIYGGFMMDLRWIYGGVSFMHIHLMPPDRFQHADLPGITSNGRPPFGPNALFPRWVGYQPVSYGCGKKQRPRERLLLNTF